MVLSSSVILVALVFTGLLIQGVIDDPVNGALGLVVPAIGAVVYFIFDQKLKKEVKQNA